MPPTTGTFPSSFREGAFPKNRASAAAPRLILSTVTASLLWAACAFPGKGDPSPPVAAPSPIDPLVLIHQAKLYTQYCASCHMEDASGVPGVEPPLTQDPVVNGEPKRLILVLLRGPAAILSPGRVAGENIMPKFDYLSDDDLAALLSYIRTNFGNQSVPIDPSLVKACRR